MRDPHQELTQLKDQQLLRQLPAVSDTLLNFSSNDYLGLSCHPALINAAIQATQKYGTSSTASRLVCGNHRPHEELESEIARLKKSDAALTFSNGYTTALGTLTALTQPGDTIILDKRAHACLIDAARLAQAQAQNKVTLRIFPHNHLEKLEKLLQTTRAKSAPNARIIIVTESVFSMDGNLCPLSEIVALKEQYEALLLLDEAHGTGVLGPTGLGLTEELQLQGKIDLQMGTLGKALGSAGGYLAASQSTIDLLINKARSFIYSTAPPPSQAYTSLAALKILQSAEGQERLKQLHHNLETFNQSFLNRPEKPPTPIIPLILGSNESALKASASLLSQDILTPAIRFPTVPQNTARLRITLSATHRTDEIHQLAHTLSQLPEFQARQP